MSFGENVGNQFGLEGAKILVWGAVGDKLKTLDKNRMLALIQEDPDYYLSVITNMEMDEVIKALLSLEGTDEEIPDSLEALIYKMNKLDTIFIEATKFLHESGDMLATGSFITGEFEQKKAILKTMGRVPNENIKGNDKTK